MMILYRFRQQKQIAYLLLAALGVNILAPSVSYGLTGGPSQPEFSSFEPVSTNQMVDEFTGDFTYNLPVLNVPGPAGSDYPLSLSYHSGASPEEEASWVGYGWTLNPGAITRNTRGFPDDYDGASVVYRNKAPKNWTATVGVSKATEVFGKDFLSNSASLRYNSYQGFGYNIGAGISFGKGIAALGYSLSDGKSSFSASVNPAAILFQTKARASENAGAATHADLVKSYQEKGKLPVKSVSASSMSILGGNYGLLSYSEAVRANHVSGYNGAAFNLSVNFQANFLPVPVGQTVNVNGSYSFQTNTERTSAPAYGYMYTSSVYNTPGGKRNKDAVEDYYLDKDTPYSKRDTYLGVPINNADQFSVNGEGIGGSFRLYHEKVGEFTPNEVSSNVIIQNLATEIAGGLTFGPGTDIGAGLQRLTEGPWKDNHQQFSNPTGGDEKPFFRFTNDLGGEWDKAHSDEPVHAQVSRNGPVTSGLPNAYPSSRTGRSSFIAYHTQADVNGATKGRKFSHRPVDVSMPVNATLPPKAICEMSVVAATGTQYIYGLPLLNKNEKNLHYSIVNEAPANIKFKHLAYTNKLDRDISAISGEERDTPYAGSFLLTETRTPDYVDRTFDGPTPDDFGGYTRFNYEKQYGGVGGWYNWRSPYSGLLYQANSLSDQQDDLGSMSCGEKEVATLHSIQTKTHTAIFILSGGERQDGFDAKTGIDARTPAYSGTGTKGLKRLDRIKLYSNNDIYYPGNNGIPAAKSNAVPIKTVRFDYFDPSGTGTLSRNVLNGTGYIPDGTPAGIMGAGKLTLKRIWFEYQGIQTQISPYSFAYAYPSVSYPDKYAGLKTGFGFNADQQNPVYSSFDLDAWGNYQAGGAGRFANKQSWVNQAPTSGFDPAAWQLKVITLPTGGQIHVQYEQDDYAYVQDKPAHVMVPLQPGPLETELTGTSNSNVFTLNLANIGITSAADILATKEAIEREYANRPGRKIYFKFLYSLLGNNPPLLNPMSCNSEYINGYTTLSSAAINANNQLVLTLGSGGANSYTLPKQACQDFANTQRNGKLNAPGICDPSVNNVSDQGLGPVALMRYILQRFGSIGGFTQNCAKLSLQHSYFRIPVVKAKKGGGLRVKRLLTFDSGYDGEAVLYGSEYLYQMREPGTGRLISSGVATTEPGGQREENILVDFMPRENQNLWSKIVAGEDLKQAEGPLGEGLLPAPLVGYSRVVTRNIHSGRTTTGYSVSEFATARQYPMQVKATAIQSEKEYRLLTAVLVNDQVNNLYAGQGFSFILNNMHGQPLRKATYPGDYVNEQAELTAAPSSEQIFTYFEPTKIAQNGMLQEAENVPVDAGAGVITGPSHPGREVDLTSAQRSVKDTMYDLNFELDVDVTFLFFFVLGYATVFPTLSRSSTELCTHATSKVIRYPAILKKVRTLQDGIVHTSENLAFDQFTGQPVLVQTNDEFAGGYLQQTQMASWLHPRFGSKASGEGLEMAGGTPGAAIGTVTVSPTDQVTYLTLSNSACAGLNKLTRGDLIELTGNQSTGNQLTGIVFHVDEPDLFANRVRVYPVKLPTNSQSFQTSNNTYPIVAGTLDITKLRVLSSGNTNQLATVAGSTTYHNADLTIRTTPGAQLASTASNFATDLNAELGLSGNNPTAGSAPVSFTLPRAYSGMNVSAFSHLIPANSGINPSSAEIRDVKISVISAANGKRRVLIDEFTMSVPNSIPLRIVNSQ